MTEAKPDLSFLVVSHAAIHADQDVFGPAHNVVEHLDSFGYSVDFVLHPLRVGSARIERSYRNGELVREERGPARGRVGEFLSNARSLRGTNADVVILVDPLNYASAFRPSLRRRGRPQVRVYYTADYADRRFESTLANAVYHRLDRLAVQHADIVWSVSNRIAAVRARQGVEATDSFVIPNAPPYLPAVVLGWPDRAPDSVVCAGMLDSILDWQLMTDAIALLSPKRADLRVRLVGDGPDRSTLVQRLRGEGLERHVEFCGLLPHQAALDVISTSRVGLALYSGSAVWNEYGDSVKVREYVARGVPVVSTLRHPLAEELRDRGAGIIVESADETAHAIESLLDDVAGDASMRALAMAADADRTTTLTAALLECERRLR